MPNKGNFIANRVLCTRDFDTKNFQVLHLIFNRPREKRFKEVKMKKTLIIAAIAAILATGCSKGTSTTSSTAGSTGSNGTSTGTKPKVLKITMIAKSQSNPVFPVAEIGAKAAAAELSKSTGVKITIDWETPTDEDPQQQANNVTEAVNNGAGCILLDCSDANKVRGAVNDAVAKGVPVMTFDSDCPNSKRFAYYGTNDLDCGVQVMDALAKVLNGKGNVAILAGNQNAPNLQARVRAVELEAKKYPGIKIVTVANHPETPEDATQKVIDVMQAYPQITGWAMVGGWPLFATGLLTALNPNKVKVVSVDALPAELFYVDKGIAPVLLAQPVYNWGYVSVKMAVNHILNGKVYPEYNKMSLIPITKANLGPWARVLQKWDVPNIDPKFLKMQPGQTINVPTS